MESENTSTRSCGCSASGCGTATGEARDGVPRSSGFIVGSLQTPAGPVQQISTDLRLWDHVGTVRARLGVRRDQYRIEPGLYAVGHPTNRSDVMVTANYKLTFDTLRKNLAGLNVWLLVLDTKGVNVWCAAGKGTFGTEELVRRIRLTSLERIVIHRRLILPQLSATGVAAHLVKKASGFTVLYGPIRAIDIQAFIRASYRATDEMRQVRFNWYDRLAVVPNDFMYGLRYLVAAVLVFTIVSAIDRSGISFQNGLTQAAMAATGIGAGYIAGIVITPLFLPLVPIRMFAFKGYAVGLVVSLILIAGGILGGAVLETLSWVFLISAVSSFMAMNFTGSSTYTSLSGVKKEMKIAVPVQIASVAVSMILMVANNIL